MSRHPKRILIKISGEGLSCPDQDAPISYETLIQLAEQIRALLSRGYEIGIVIGGGNLWRGNLSHGAQFERTRSDYIGMLATMMNGLALYDVFQHVGVSTLLLSSLNISVSIARRYSIQAALEGLQAGQVVILIGGTGRPFFSTDTATGLFALEVQADVILMGKNGVDGVYDRDPREHNNAKRYDELTYQTLVCEDLRVMDLTCATMLQNTPIETYVFNVQTKDSFIRVLDGSIARTRLRCGNQSKID